MALRVNLDLALQPQLLLLRRDADLVLEITRDYPRLPEITRDYPRLPEITRDHLRRNSDLVLARDLLSKQRVISGNLGRSRVISCSRATCSSVSHG